MRTITNLIMVFAGLAMLVGCQEKQASEVVDGGEIVNNVYTNAYFGFTMALPPSWHSQSQQTQREIVESGLDSLEVNHEAVEASLSQRTVNLIGLFKRPIGSDGFNPNILGLAERADDVLGLKRGRDYHVYTKKMFATNSVSVSYPQEIYTETISGVDFDVMTMKMENNGAESWHKQYATVRKDYVLLFGLSYDNEADEAEMDALVRAVVFQQGK